MKHIHLILLVSISSLVACKNATETKKMETVSPTADSTATKMDTFEVSAESFADIQVLRYQIPGWSSLSLKEKELCYYLYEAALSGRDIIYDQKDKNGILLRKTLENIYDSYPDDKTNSDWLKFEEYCGRFWFSNGNHRNFSATKNLFLNAVGIIFQNSWINRIKVDSHSNPTSPWKNLKIELNHYFMI